MIKESIDMSRFIFFEPVMNIPISHTEMFVKKEAFQLSGQLLHAGEIGFIHPDTEQEMTFYAPLPLAFEHVLEILRNARRMF